MDFYGDLMARDTYKPYLCLEFGDGKVYTGIVKNDIG